MSYAPIVRSIVRLHLKKSLNIIKKPMNIINFLPRAKLLVLVCMRRSAPTFSPPKISPTESVKHEIDVGVALKLNLASLTHAQDYQKGLGL